jgi:fatty-acyl-CoA synthase/feruloyl-CoA synthase
MATLGEALARSARRHPDREAVVTPHERWSYAELDARVGAAARELAARGLRKGDRLALLAGNDPGFIVALYAALRLGAIFVPINPRSAPPEVEFILGDSGARVFAFSPALRETADAVAPGEAARVETTELLAAEGDGVDAAVEEADDAEILYTSGTTGRPKGVLLDHHRVIWVGVGIATAVGLREGDRMLHVAPFYHSAELNLFLTTGMTLGCTHVVPGAFEPAQTLELLERERIATFFGVPTMYQLLLRDPALAERDLSAWRIGMFGAAPMAPAVIERLVAALPGVELYNLCGLTEAGPGGIYLQPQDLLRKPGAGGTAIPNTEARVVDDDGRDVAAGETGELILRGETVMKRYWNRPDATAETLRADGWLYTGDVARIDEEGYITLVDRKKDMIITGGMNVYSIEVENALLAHPDVLDCAVVSAPHELYGESIVAVVDARPGAELTLEHIRAHCAPRLADYKAPHRLVLAPIPRNPSGKILKYRLREQVV